MSLSERSLPNVILQEPRGNIVPHLLCLLAQIVFLASPSFPGRRYISAGTIFGLAILAHFSSPFSKDVGVVQPWSLMWVFWLATIERFLFCNAGTPETSYWRVDRAPIEGKYMRPFSIEKLRWAFALITNLRGVRWNWQVKNVLPAEETRRWKFVWAQFGRFLIYLLISDLLLQLSIRLFWEGHNNHTGGTNSKYLTIRHQHLGWSLINTLVFALGPYYFINLQYIFASIVAVLLGWSQPEDWIPLFGKLNQVTTVRSFWGQFWHQFIRRPVSSISDFVLRTLAIPRGTLISKYLQIWIAFSVSGLLHAQANLMLPCPVNITSYERAWGTLFYFLWQAAAITFEDLVQWSWVRVGGSVHPHSRLRTLIGYTWVICSFWISLPWAADDMMRMRLTEKSFLPFSLTRDLMRIVPMPPKV